MFMISFSLGFTDIFVGRFMTDTEISYNLTEVTTL